MYRSFRVLLAALLLLPASQSVQAIAIWPSMPGSWAGLAQNSALPAVQLPAVQLPAPFAVTRQFGGTFAGEVTLPAVQTPGVVDPGPSQYNFIGTVAQVPATGAAELMSVVGRSTDGGRFLVMYGKTVAMGDGSVRVASLRYGVVSLRGALLEQGYLLVLQRIGGLNWRSPGPVQDVTGLWDGTYASAPGASGGTLAADLVAIADGATPAGAPILTSAFVSGAGGLHFESGDPVAALGFTLDAQGTVGLPAVQRDGSLAAPWAMIGSGPGPTAAQPGVIGLLIGLLRSSGPTAGPPAPSSIQGDYLLYSSLADVFDGLWRGTNTSFDHGTFVVAR